MTLAERWFDALTFNLRLHTGVSRIIKTDCFINEHDRDVVFDAVATLETRVVQTGLVFYVIERAFVLRVSEYCKKRWVKSHVVRLAAGDEREETHNMGVTRLAILRLKIQSQQRLRI